MEVMERMRLAMHHKAQQDRERVDFVIREREALRLADSQQKQQAIDQLTKMMPVTLERLQTGSGSTVAGGAPPPPPPGGGNAPGVDGEIYRARPSKVTTTFAAGSPLSNPSSSHTTRHGPPASPSGR